MLKIPYRLVQNPPQLARFSFSAALTLHLPQTDSHICEHSLYVWECAALNKTHAAEHTKVLCGVLALDVDSIGVPNLNNWSENPRYWHEYPLLTKFKPRG